MTLSYDIASRITNEPLTRFERQIAEVGANGGIVDLTYARFRNDGDETPTGAALTVVTAQLSNDGAPCDGKEMVVGKWLEANVDGLGPWVPIGDGDSISLPVLAPLGSIGVALRLNVPAGAVMFGTIEPKLCVMVW